MREIGKFLLVNLGISLLFGTLTILNMRRPSLLAASVSFSVSFVFASITGGLAWYVLPRVVPRIHGPRWWVWTRVLALLAAVGVAGGTLGHALLVSQPFVRLGLRYAESVSANIILTLLIGSITTMAERAKAQLEQTTLQLRTRELENERALKAAADAKLQSLESRIHPHFLFNTLNSISALVRSDPDAAEKLIERLADLLRFSLDRHGGLVSLEDEIAVTTSYLEIERARFGDRLRYSFDVPAALLSTSVPALSLQTLAENSVKYAVSTSRAGATISIRAFADGGAVRLEVVDTGPGFSPDSLPLGHGLDTLRQRLESFFGARTSLSAKPLDPGMEVSFRVPC